MPARRLWRALTRNVAETAPNADDPRLRGRTYAVPFERVWTAALALADGGLRGWRVVAADDGDGVIEATATSLVFKYVDDVRIRIGLDANGQTRVDARSASRKGRGDFGANARRLGRFFRKLDRALASPVTKQPPLPGAAV